LPDDTLQIIPLRYDETTFLEHIKRSQARVVLENIFEGSNTFVRMLEVSGLLKDTLNGRYATISTGEMPESINNCNIQFMMYLTGRKNESERHILNIYSQRLEQRHRPYTFLYLNNRVREHRAALLNEMERMQLLDGALWSHIPTGKTLPEEYEQDRDITHRTLVDWDQWEAGLMVERQYYDTYFSVQAESTVKLRYSMFSEKTWKPILGEHPFITLSGVNHYHNLRRMGFQTFDHVLGSEWQEMEPWQVRMQEMVSRIVRVVGPNLHDIMHDQETRKQAQHNLQQFWRWYDNYEIGINDSLSKFLEELVS